MSVIQSLISTSSGKAEPPLMLMCMATCHSLTVIDDVLSGDPLDLKVSLTNMHSSLLSIELIVFSFIKRCLNQLIGCFTSLQKTMRTNTITFAQPS